MLHNKYQAFYNITIEWNHIVYAFRYKILKAANLNIKVILLASKIKHYMKAYQYLLKLYYVYLLQKLMYQFTSHYRIVADSKQDSRDKDNGYKFLNVNIF